MNPLNENSIKKLAFILPAIGLTCILLYALTALSLPISFHAFKHFLTSFSILVLIGIASFILGGGTGFLFGIPRMNTEVSSDTSRYLPNTNLEQVSDWLTKILVGLGLTQLNEVISIIHSLSNEAIKGLTTLGAKNGAGVVFVESLIVYFVVVGFLVAYLLTRIHLSRILQKAELYLSQQEKES